MNIFASVSSFAAYPLLVSYLTVQSGMNRIRAASKPDTVHFQAPYSGQPIVLLALFEKGVLRPDTIRFLETCHAAGCYVVGVNTLRLTSPKDTEGVLDCYIERFNFGRDFGSYKTGFLHIYEQGFAETCPRLLMINDSVFFSNTRMPTFLDDMMTSEMEVLGSTENFEISHHLGSFCISMSGDILRHGTLRRYWADYRQSDVRPRVIRTGEKRLSKVLKQCVSSPSELGVRYGVQDYYQMLREDDAFLDFAIRNTRESNLTGWKRLSRKKVVDNYKDEFLITPVETNGYELHMDLDNGKSLQKLHVNSFEELCEAASADLKPGSQIDREALKASIISRLTEVFISGSQIHQNGAVLVKMGLPIVKLDGLYRGMFSIRDISNIEAQLEEGEAEELVGLLLERPYGGDTLRGWRSAAFFRGLI